MGAFVLWWTLSDPSECQARIEATSNTFGRRGFQLVKQGGKQVLR
jgi:hypothetical protein